MINRELRACLAAATCFALPFAASAQPTPPLIVDLMRITDAGIGEKIGTVTLRETTAGLAMQVTARGIAVGPHGFHLHQNAECGPALKNGRMMAGEAAGEHYDPEVTKSHKGPGKGGHKGDLPVLQSTPQGIDASIAAAHLKLSDVIGRSLVIHDGPDNYSDTPESGGGGARIACAVIPARQPS